MRRMFDVLGAGFGLLMLFPVLIIIAIAVKIDSPGDIFFLQERLGKDGKVFRIIKFRTMIMNAVQIGDGLFIREHDPRITSVGEFLRRTSLDELPQLLNVLRGEMSLIGPRPPIPQYPCRFEEYSTHQRLRFSVLPGITGYAQVKGRTSISWDERIELDVEYVKRRNWALDAWIMCETVLVVLTKRNIYEK